MKLPRRQFLHLAAGAAALPTVSVLARAQTYPTRPVTVIVGFGPAGVADISARLMGQWLSERLGRQFVIENRTGAAGNIGTNSVVRAAPDGYTLLLVAPPNAINATLYDKLNFIRDIAPVAGIIRSTNVMLVHPSVPAKTVPDFISYAKANPGKINMGSGGVGTSVHMSGELFKMMAGVDMVHIPDRSGSITDLLSGQVQVEFFGLVASIEYIRAGTLRALAVTTATRSETLRDIPAVAEFLPGYEASAFFGIGAPKGTPARDQCGPGRSQAKAATRRLGRDSDWRFARRLWEAYRRRNGEMGQGDPGGQYQADCRRPAAIRHSFARPCSSGAAMGRELTTLGAAWPLSPGHHTALDAKCCLCDLSTQHNPWRASALAWRIRTDDNGLLGALESVDLIFKLGNPLLSLGLGTRRIRDPIDLNRQPGWSLQAIVSSVWMRC
jgi:tripartite-type tricarboxylate transporter receptor subunit TctC